jgi:hypothetical protein
VNTDANVLANCVTQIKELVRKTHIVFPDRNYSYPKLKADKKDLVALAKLYKTLSEPGIQQKAAEVLKDVEQDSQVYSMMYGSDDGITKPINPITIADYSKMLNLLNDYIEMTHYAKNHPRELVSHLAQNRIFPYQISDQRRALFDLCTKIVQAIRLQFSKV